MKKNKKDIDKHKLLVSMPYIVLHVLLRNKALGLYCNNVLSTDTGFYCAKDWMYSKDPLVWIDSAFHWKSSPEGEEFWINIYSQVINQPYE